MTELNVNRDPWMGAEASLGLSHQCDTLLETDTHTHACMRGIDKNIDTNAHSHSHT